MTLLRSSAMVLALALIAPAIGRADVVVDFADKSLPANSFYNGSDLAGGFTSAGAFFNNSYNTRFGSWSGWSYSTATDTTTFNFRNQYSAITGAGVGGSGTYGVAFDFAPNASFINLPGGMSAASVFVTNTTFAYLAMLGFDQLPGGNNFSRKFTTGDFFTLTIRGFTGLNATGASVGAVDFDLARYATANDRPVDVWTEVNLSRLAGARSLGFELASSDVGPFGINTPTYFALDNLRLTPGVPVPEPSGLALAGLGGLGAWLVRRRLARR